MNSKGKKIEVEPFLRSNSNILVKITYEAQKMKIGRFMILLNHKIRLRSMKNEHKSVLLY